MEKLKLMVRLQKVYMLIEVMEVCIKELKEYVKELPDYYFENKNTKEDGSYEKER